MKDNSIKITEIQEKTARLQKNKRGYELLEEKLKASGQSQISATDEGARALLVQGVVVEVSYIIQAAVDNEHNLVVDTFTVLVDKGYHNGRGITQCKDNNITTFVAHPTLE